MTVCKKKKNRRRNCSSHTQQVQYALAKRKTEASVINRNLVSTKQFHFKCNYLPTFQGEKPESFKNHSYLHNFKNLRKGKFWIYKIQWEYSTFINTTENNLHNLYLIANQRSYRNTQFISNSFSNWYGSYTPRLCHYDIAELFNISSRIQNKLRNLSRLATSCCSFDDDNFSIVDRFKYLQNNNFIKYL